MTAPSAVGELPLVSVIVPAFNAANYLPETIQSVLTQTWPCWELIIVDDGSTDETPAICAQYSEPRIRYVRTANRGVSCARNEGLARATGEFLAFLDADDHFLPESLTLLAEYLMMHPEADLVVGAMSIRSSDMTLETRCWVPTYSGPLFRPFLALDAKVIGHLGCYLLRSCVLGDVRFNPGMTHAEDTLFYLTMAHRREQHLVSIPNVVYWYRVGHASAMRDLQGLERGYAELVAHVWRWADVPFRSRLCLRIRVVWTMFMSWLGAAKPYHALRSVVRLLRPIMPEGKSLKSS